ncbi:L,D-transpeptidase family protein [Streptomyces sp. NPDC050504]|uniref:L,D-transpeptidase family protein n=1 Tax=Streptomyces sp. NPDC050504 TaxID=3365618 RepID=UPI0037B267EE
MESLLGLKADGKQSAADCRAIRAFQRKYGVEPANGAAGAITYTTLYARWASARPGRLKGCPASRKRIVCVDLSHQILWVKKRGKVLFGPVPIRSGRPGHETRTGWFRVYWRHKAHWSTAYHSPMPYSQFFSGGQAFHGIYSNLLRNPASYGCVNLRYDDSVKLWKILRKNDKVRIWGRRPR